MPSTKPYLRLVTMLACACWSMSAPCHATEPEPEPDVQRVIVRATGGAPLRSYQQMLDGLNAFEKYQSHAPDSRRRFQLVPLQGRAALKTIRLSIASGDEITPVAVDADGRFDLPRLDHPEPDAQLKLSLRSDSVRWRPYVRTPGVPADQLRLGDLRIECRVFDAVDERSMSFTQRMGLSLLGGACVGSRVDFWALAPARIDGVTLVHGNRRVALPQTAIGRNGETFIAPVNDAGWPDDTRIEFSFVPVAP
ncbi:hypothetical protein [Rugamonas rivuli]|uniref:Uncharacterized protein n=1 Tax=Rugamonas rivuli TaxID=2743358 RepID=A0A843SJH2_9BURK|nr:hypothetical protein [Rugamonas rivuli]MQA22628.1 hypothetical protein [Rugamonas rivuli]